TAQVWPSAGVAPANTVTAAASESVLRRIGMTSSWLNERGILEWTPRLNVLLNQAGGQGRRRKRGSGADRARAERHQVREQPKCAGHTFGQLPEQCEAGIDVPALAEWRSDNGARLWRLARIGHR